MEARGPVARREDCIDRWRWAGDRRGNHSGSLGCGARLWQCLMWCPNALKVFRRHCGQMGPRRYRWWRTCATRSSAALRFDTVVAELGGIDVLANVAGGMFGEGADRSGDRVGWNHVEDCSTADWDLNAHMNLRYVFWLSRLVLPKMAARGGGSMVSVTSISGVFGAPNHAAYGAAKAGLIHLTKTLAVEYGRSGIRVNVVSPGSIATPANGMDEESAALIGRNLPLQRAGVPDDIARAMLYFASPMSDYITGQNAPRRRWRRLEVPVHRRRCVRIRADGIRVKTTVVG